jgi:hypothetical protein
MLFIPSDKSATCLVKQAYMATLKKEGTEAPELMRPHSRCLKPCPHIAIWGTVQHCKLHSKAWPVTGPPQ